MRPIALKDIFALDQPRITSIIDWQSGSVLPLYIPATFAKFAQYTGDDVVYEYGRVLPVLRVPLEDSPPAEHARLTLELKQAHFQKMYEIHLKTLSPWNYAVHAYPFIEQVRLPVQRTARTWFEGIHHLRQCIFRIIQQWEEIAPDVSLPLEIAQDEWENHKASFARHERYETRVGKLRKELDIDADGWTFNENYEAAKERSMKLMAEWDEEVEGGPYPFQDGAPAWFINISEIGLRWEALPKWAGLLALVMGWQGFTKPTQPSWNRPPLAITRSP